MEGYVVVTIAGDVVHAYGAPDGSPLPDRGRAQTLARRLAREDAEQYRDGALVDVRTCKILGDRSGGA